MKIAHLTIALLLFFISSCQQEPPSTPDAAGRGGTWHIKGIKEVRAYRINWDDRYGYQGIRSPEGILAPDRLPENGIILSTSQVKILEGAVTGQHPLHEIAMCFNPHHAFLFFDRDDAIIGEINICFLCSNYQATPEGFAKTWDLDALRALFKDLGIPLSNRNWK